MQCLAINVRSWNSIRFWMASLNVDLNLLSIIKEALIWSYENNDSAVGIEALIPIMRLAMHY